MTPKLKTLLPESTSYLLLTHTEPDFDGFGSMIGLQKSLRLAGYSVLSVAENIPFYMEHLPGIETVLTDLPVTFQPYSVIALDAASKERVYRQEWLENALQVINIDHHHDNPLFGDINLVNTHVSSTSEHLFQLLGDSGFPMDEEIVSSFYAGLLYDTGGFRYSNTHSQTFLSANQMMKACPEKIPDVSEWVFSRWDQHSLQALTKAIQHAEYWFNEKVCISALPYSVCASLPAVSFEGIVDILRLHHSVQIIIFLREIEPGVVKGSLRSKPPYTVSDIAHYFNGGGHARASGFTSRSTTLEKVREKIIQMLTPAWETK